MRGRRGEAGEEGAVVVDEGIVQPSLRIQEAFEVCCGERPVLPIRVEGQLDFVWVSLKKCV